MKKNIVLIGDGGHCNSCIDVIESTNKFKIVGLISKNKKFDIKKDKYKYIGEDRDLSKIFKKFKYAHITIGQIKNLDLRKKLFDKLKKIGFKLPTIISKYSIVSKNAKIGEGSIIMHNAVVNYNAEIGKNCIINTKAVIEHDSTIGAHTHISTSCTINGGNYIGEQCFIGSGTITKENTKIKNKSYIKMLSKI